MFPKRYRYWEWVDGVLIQLPTPVGPSVFLDPVLGPERGWPQDNPLPSPWLESVAFLVAAATSKEAALQMSDEGSVGVAKQQTIAGIDQAIAAFIDSDDICPPWPWPGPPPWIGIIASELTLIANTLQDGSLRTGLLSIAGQVLGRAALNPAPRT